MASKIRVRIKRTLADSVKSARTLPETELAELITKLSDHYYNGVALVSDAVFDDLQDILREKYPHNPVLSAIGSPSQPLTDLNVSQNDRTITNNFHRIRQNLPYWMGSMDKIKPGGSNLSKWLQKYPLSEKILSDKMDGVSALLVIDTSGHKLFTRGDGHTGQDISCILPYLKLPKSTIAHKMAIRAELIMSKHNFLQFRGEAPNARNLVSGIINSKTVKIDLLKQVDMICYEIIDPNTMTPSNQFQLLTELGYSVVPYKTVTNSKITEAQLTEYFAARRAISPYEIDGIIVCDNALYTRNCEGNPKYAFAFKTMIDEEEQVVETEILEVNWQIQKDGYLFPSIRVMPVFVSGVTIQNCSGKNAKYVVDNCLGPGSKIRIRRDGDVIPGIYEILTPSATGSPSLPDIPYHWTGTGVDLVINDIGNNEEVQLKRLITFFRTIGVVGFSEGLITKCYNNGLDTINRILLATVVDFLKLPQIQIKMAEKIWNNLQAAFQTVQLDSLMVASNVFGRGFGIRRIQLLLTHIPDIVDRDTTTSTDQTVLITDICQIPGFDTKTATQFVTKLSEFQQFQKSLPSQIQDRIVNTGKIVIKPPTSSQFQGETYVFTGFRNKDWERQIVDGGGKIGSTLSGATTMLVIRDHSYSSGKVTKAKEMGIPVIDMAEFTGKYNMS